MTAGFATSDYAGRFELVQELGRGATSVVVLAKDRLTGDMVAIKRMDRAHVPRGQLRAELLHHARLHHPHVIGLRGAFVSARHVNLVLDYASGGSLLDLVRARGRLREPLARWFFQQIIIAVDYSHARGIAVRDIKLDNLLLKPVPGLPQPVACLADFGFSTGAAPGSRAYAKVGTLAYAAPEVLSNRGAGYDARAADAWSCGVVLFTLLAGGFPFRPPPSDLTSDALPAALAALLGDIKGRRFVLPEGISGGAARLICRLLEPDPARRATIAEVMQDEWFKAQMPPKAATLNARCLALRPAGAAALAAEVRGVVAALDLDASSSGSGSDDGSYLSS